MSISITSTTDAPEAVTAALGDLAPKTPATETNPATDVKAKATEEADPNTEIQGKAETEGEAETSELDENEDEGLEAKGDEESPDSGDQKPKKKGGFQKRIDKLNTRLSVKDQEIDYWKQQALGKQSPSKTEEKIETKPDLTQKPKADDFVNHGDYVEALTDWKVEQKLLAKEQHDKDTKVKSEQQSKVTTHLTRVEEFKTSHDDWDDVIENVGSIQLTIPIQTAIVESENSAELMYELAKQPKELARIVSLSPLMAVKELGKFEERITKTSEPSTKTKTSNAPKPVTPVRTRGASSPKSIYDPEISQREFERQRAEQEKARRAY